MADAVTGSPGSSTPLGSPAGDFTAATLTLGVIGYGLLCAPAIGQRGFPPIDPAWEAMPFLWPAPLMLSLLFDTRPWRERRVVVAWYCVFTAFLAAGTMPTVVPKQIDLGQMALGTIVLAPLFLLIAMALEGLAQVAHRLCGRPPLAATVRSWPRWLVAFALVAGAGAAPFAFRGQIFRLMHNRGRAAAERDWQNQSAVVYTDHNIRVQDDLIFGTEVDRATGFSTRHSFSTRGYAEAYNQRIAELVAERGLPDWSLKSQLPTDEQLVAWLDDPSLAEVRSFPAELTDSIVITAGGTFERWGQISSSPGISIHTPHGGGASFGDGTAKVYTGQIPARPRLLIIRQDDRWVGVYREDGRLVASLYRDRPATAAPPAPRDSAER